MASGGENNTGAGPAKPLQEGVATGRDNEVRVAPFEVRNVDCPNEFDPGYDRLRLSYDIHDPNGRVERGRILYLVPGKADAPAGSKDAEPVIVHRQRLLPGRLQHKSHTLLAGECWDGTISEGLAERVGQKVTADLSPITVVVEVWNKPAEPGKRKGMGSGKTDVPGQYLSRDDDRTHIDVVVEAEWDRRFVIPYDDPDEPQHGKAKMKIKVRHVAEGTDVRLLVARINDIKRPGSDFRYTLTGGDHEPQPGLDNATVQGDRVLLPDGTEPEVRFNEFDRHWKHPGNNFYAFWVAFGERGRWIRASERDYKTREKKCLHMRYTVFVHGPSYDLPDSISYAQKLHKFFRNETKYYRSYLMLGGPKSNADWAFHFRHRYIVIHLGHASCNCFHAAHPKYQKKKGKKVIDGALKDMFHSGFAPDGNVCPTGIESTKEAKKRLKEDLAHYKKSFGGCGQKSHVEQAVVLGRPKKGKQSLGFWNPAADVYPDKDPKAGQTRRESLLIGNWDGSNPNRIPMKGNTPRLYYHCSGCRTILTTNMGEYAVDNGTRYFSGWVYSTDVSAKFDYEVFTHFIKGSKADPALDPATGEPTEDLVERLVPSFRLAASKSYRAKDHPRIMDPSGVLNRREDPAKADKALK